jgi:hypothetical protein
MTGDGRQEVPAGQVDEYNTYAGTYTFNAKGLITSCLHGHRSGHGAFRCLSL